MDWSVFTEFDFDVISKYLPALLNGLANNILLTVFGFLAGGIILAIPLALASLSKYRLIRWPTIVFVEFWR